MAASHVVFGTGHLYQIESAPSMVLTGLPLIPDALIFFKAFLQNGAS
jgi:hypothetical protein